MRMAAAADEPAHAIRVFVATPDAALETRWRAMIVERGHAVAESFEAADVVLTDGESIAPHAARIISITHAETNAAGALPPGATVEQIDAAIRAVAAGLLVRSALARASGFAALDDHAHETLLTPREIEVLSCIAEGLTNKLIARRLEISPHTVKFHLESVLRKLGVTTRAQAVATMLERRRSGEDEREV